MLAIGTKAPDFELNATPDQKLRLKDFTGKRLILAFYPADWNPVCGDQMALYNETLKVFKKHNAEIVGISVDGKWCHMALPITENSIFHCLLILNPKVKYQKLMAFTTKEKDSPNRLCL